MGPPATESDQTEVPNALSDTERAVLGEIPPAQARSRFSAYTRDRLGSAVARVLFRAGRIDVVWGVVLDDGREVVLKCHRRPAHLGALAAARDAKTALAAHGYPCPTPLSGPDDVGGWVLAAETLLGAGSVPDGRLPENRRLLAEGLVSHVDILRGRPDLLGRAGPGPSWCHHAGGPWPVPHDPVVDFRSTPEGYAWLDAHGRRASDQIRQARTSADLVVGHADWYAGNTRVDEGRLVGTFDWELVVDTEAVVAGFAAACYAASSTSSAGLSTPEDAVAFLRDHEAARGLPFTDDEQRAAAGAAAWILAFNARWELGMRGPGPDGPVVALVRERQADYLALRW